MSLLTTARDALKELPLSDIVRERLSLALDRLAEAEAKIEALQAENAELKAENRSLRAELEGVRRDHQQDKKELRRIQDEHAEEVRVHGGVEFRRGKRTGGGWVPFCPACHLPADLSLGIIRCAGAGCGWQVLLSDEQVRGMAAGL